MSKDNLKITITMGNRKVETDSDAMDALAKALKKKGTRKEIIEEALRIKDKESP